MIAKHEFIPLNNGRELNGRIGITIDDVTYAAKFLAVEVPDEGVEFRLAVDEFQKNFARDLADFFQKLIPLELLPIDEPTIVEAR